MRIIQEEDSETLRFSFYLMEGGRIVGVWMGQKQEGIKYYLYADNFCLNETREGRSESSELHFLLCCGHSANEVFQEALKAKSGFIYELKRNRRL